MSTQSARSPASAENKSILALVLLSLHVAGFLLIAGVLIPTEADMFIAIPTSRLNINLFLFLFAGLDLVSGYAWGRLPSYGRKFGLALSVSSVPFYVLLLASSWALDVSLPKSGLFILLSLVDSLAIVIILVTLRALSRPR